MKTLLLGGSRRDQVLLKYVENGLHSFTVVQEGKRLLALANDRDLQMAITTKATVVMSVTMHKRYGPRNKMRGYQCARCGTTTGGVDSSQWIEWYDKSQGSMI